MIAAILALALQQTPQLNAEMRVDFDRVPLGGEVVLTVRARSASPDPIEITLPPLAGLELIARSERTEVMAGASLGRTTMLELRLRGSMPGKWRIGPARIRQGKVRTEADPVEVEVTGSAATGTAAAASIGPNVQKLLAQSRPPRSGQDASVAIILSSSSAYIGEQVDVVTAAWFPRELRLQLRRPPTVQTPSIDGVYSYPQRSPTGIAASRQVDGRWFDLFIVHQIVFPLTAGRIRVPPATLHYSVPLAFQFFSQEERYAVHSDPAILDVKSLPPGGRPAAFSGGVGHGLTIERSLTPRSGRAGEPFTVDVVLKGEGNVALWPPPDIEWPGHLRAYSEKVNDVIEIKGGRLGGAKTFRYVVIPDSARTAGLASLDYSYFDPATRSYTSARAPAVSYLVTPAPDVPVSRASPAALKLDYRPAAGRRLLNGVPPWLLFTLVLAAPMLVLLRRTPIRKPRVIRSAGGTGDPMASAEDALTRALASLVPQLPELEGEKLETALRSAGIDPTAARHAVEVRDRLRAARYGPMSQQDRKGIIEDARRMAESLAPSWQGDRIRSAIGAGAALLMLALLPPHLHAQASPEQLYESGALGAAAAAFEQRARIEPDIAAHWFNLGAARFRMGEAGSALAAWSRAERLAPRDGSIRRALRLVPAADTRSARALWAPPFTPEELAVLAALLWITGWLGYAWNRKSRWLTVVLGSLVAAAGALALSLWYQRPLGVVTADQSLAVSPHELAPAVVPVAVGSVVRVIQQSRGWAMVKEANGRVGWLPLDTIEQI